VPGLGAIALLAAIIRIAYTLVVSADLPTIGDAETYHLLANNLADGEGYIRPHDLEPVPTAEFPPLFPAVLSILSIVGADSITAHKLFTSLLGVVTVVLIGLLGRRVAGPAVGLVAAGLAALYPMLFQVDGALMAESLYVPLVTGSLLATYWAIDPSVTTESSRPALVRWAVAGGLAGLAALTRTEAVLLVPLVFVPEALRHVSGAWGRKLACAGVAAAALVAVISPWLVRNYLTFDRFVPISNNSGTLLAGANCDPTYSGPMRGQWRLDCITVIEVGGDNEAESVARYREVGIDYARDHADELPKVAAVRLLRTFGLYDVGGQINWETLEGRSNTWQTIGHRMYLLVAPLAIAGAVVGVVRRWPVWPLIAPVVLVAGMAVVTYGNQRFRIAAEPGLLVLASIAAVSGVAALRPSLTTILGIPEGGASQRRSAEARGEPREKVSETS
jgi:4-amino-4-deoxy-L-arabinose transferase-like glycosyltransferase